MSNKWTILNELCMCYFFKADWVALVGQSPQVKTRPPRQHCSDKYVSSNWCCRWQESHNANKSDMEFGRSMANLLLLLVIVLPRLQSKPSRYKILSYYCWWRNFHSSQLICYKYPKCFLFGFLQHFPDLNWRTPETIHIHQLYPPSNISAVFWRWFFLFPPVVGTNKYLYLEPQWPLVFEGQPLV